MKSKSGHAKHFTLREASDLITAPPEDGGHLSDPDSADSVDETDFIEGIDPCQNKYVYCLKK